MKKSIMSLFIIFFIIIIIQSNFYAQDQQQFNLKTISAAKAATYIMAGKAILLHTGGEAYNRRHIMNSIEVHPTEIMEKKKPIPVLPRKGIVIFTYCY